MKDIATQTGRGWVSLSPADPARTGLWIKLRRGKGAAARGSNPAFIEASTAEKGVLASPAEVRG
jgi:hypothetical protein